MSLEPEVPLTWARESVCVHVLPDARVVRVQGDDARDWLNGQTTSDVREVDETRAVYALSVDVKGRVQADLWVTADGAGMAFVAPASATEQLLEALDRYIIMEDVELVADPSLEVVTVQGPAARSLCESVECVRRYTTQRLGAGGYDLWLTAEQRQPALDSLRRAAEESGGGLVGADSWHAALVTAAVPRFGADFGPSTYPQEAGLKARAVSFNKGCYLGQEVICMLENRGKLARSLCALEGPAGSAADTGDTCSDAEDRRVGQVTSVAPGKTPRALAMLKRGHNVAGTEIRIKKNTWRVTRVVGDDA